MQDKIIQTNILENIASAIRESGGTQNKIKISDFATEIKNIKNNLLKYHPLKTIKGNFIKLNDVCELPHNIDCKVVTNNNNKAFITVCGANLLKLDFQLIETQTIKCEKLADDRIMTNGYARQTKMLNLGPQFLLKPETYTFSGNTKDYKFVINLYDKNGILQESYSCDEKPFTFTIQEKMYCSCKIVVPASNILKRVTISPMLNIGTKALDYEPYIGKEYKLNELEDISTTYFPYLNIFANDDRTELEVTYHQSAGIVFMQNKLQKDGGIQ